MKKKIVLFYPKLEPEKKWHYVPYSALCVAGKLLAEGCDVQVVDDRLHDNVIPVLEEALKEADEIWFSVYTGYQVTRAYAISKYIKQHQHQVKITWGGPHVTAFPEQTLEDIFVDSIYTGYAERGEYLMPWHLINPSDYINPETERFIMITTYSCPGICTFCSVKQRREWLELPIAKVENDIDRLMTLHSGYRECVFFDATIFTRAQRAYDLARIMRKHNLKWIADARADEIIRMPANMLDEIMASGVTQLTIGLESGSPRIVDKMKKGKHHLENYLKCAKVMANYPFKMCSGVIFGCPGEGPEDIKLTVEYIKQIKAINPNFYISTTFFMPLPNTEMADMAKEYGYVEPASLQEWAERGEQNHFRYNDWMDNPWISEKEEYKRIYDAFISECDYLV